MSTWSINGTTRSLLGASRTLTLGARGDACMVRVLGTLSLTHGSACVVATADGTFFRGLVRRCATGKYIDNGVTVEATTIELESKWRLLERLVYTKTVPTGDDDTPKTTTRVLLCQDGDTTAAELSDLVAFASGHLTISSTLTGTVAPGWEMTDASVAEVIGSLLRFHPEAVVWYDHANDVLRMRPLSGTPQISKALDVAEGAQGGEFTTSSPVQVAGVKLIYNVTTTVDGVAFRDTIEDTAGTTSGLDVVTSTFDWSGGTFQTFRQRQEIETEAIPQSTSATNINNWVKKKVPEMGPFSTRDFKVVAIRQRNPDGEETEFTRELVNGTIQPWMPDTVEAARVEVTVKVKWIRASAMPEDLREEFQQFFGLSRERVVTVELIGTTATSQTYASTPVISGGDDDDGPPPTGVAARIYSNRPLPGPQGSAVWRSAMPDVSLHAGARLSVSGCVTTTDALVQSVTESCAGAPGNIECTTSVACGPTGFLLSAEPFQRIQRSMARAAKHRPLVLNSAAAPTGNVDGARKTPTSSGKMKSRDTVVGFQVTMERPGAVVVRQGIVVYPLWPEEIDPLDPKPRQYAEKIVGSQGFAASDGESLWLQVKLKKVNYSLDAPLGGLTTVSLQGGRGGRGGRGGLGGYGGDGGMGGAGGMGGGGGGGGGGAGPGSAGSAGYAGGYGGAGGAAGDPLGGAYAGGAGGVGGLGAPGASGLPGNPPPPFGDPDGPQDGASGDLPSPTSINIPTTTSMLARVWTLADGQAVSVVKGATAAGMPNQSTSELLFIKLADVRETEVIQYHQGLLFLPPMIAPMIPPPAEEGAG
jgi:hypothetical protein